MENKDEYFCNECDDVKVCEGPMECDYCDEKFCPESLQTEHSTYFYGLVECSVCNEYFCLDNGCMQNHEHMTDDEIKKEFESSFRSCNACDCNPFEHLTDTDKRTYYNNYTDSLCKDDRISDYQYHVMSNPY